MPMVRVRAGTGAGAGAELTATGNHLHWLGPMEVAKLTPLVSLGPYKVTVLMSGIRHVRLF